MQQPKQDAWTLKILGNMGGSCRDTYASAALIDDFALLDAGTGVQLLSLQEMLKIDHVLLTHVHLDHTAMLFFLMDCHIGIRDSLQVHCLKETADAIRRGIANGETWPEVDKLKIDGKPIMEFNYLKPYEPVMLNGRLVTPLPVKHAVPTLAFCLHGANEDFVYINDILDAEPAFWEYLNALPQFRRMVIEVSFPDEMRKVAEDSYHLTPSMLAELLKNLRDDVEVFYCHAKPQVADKIAAQVAARFGERVRALRQGEIFTL